jgi:hypothetical protein
VIPECQTYGQPGSVNANAPVGSTIAFVMSGRRIPADRVACSMHREGADERRRVLLRIGPIDDPELDEHVPLRPT